ncbi:MAG: 3-methyl-2-oxobutanoate hydroxymethyltransferase [Rickettsiales bacterium]
MKRNTINDIRIKKSGEPIVALTAYTSPYASLFDPHVDIMLVGDSLGMVLYGMENTLSVTVDIMIAHGKAVVRSTKKSLIVVDMPFASYQVSPQRAFENAARIIADTGCGAVKLEGGREMAPTVEFLVSRGIAVMGHIGLKPQSVNAMGGYRTYGKDSLEASIVMEDAVAIEKAGAFSVVIEGVVSELADSVTAEIAIPTIGIGASLGCDGQVLVSDDMLGISGGYVPSFVKQYADISSIAEEAVIKYAKEVRERKFPTSDYCYPYKKK